MGPWYEAHDPRNACDNDHEYRYDTGTWRASLAEALADAGATGYTYYVTWSIGGVGDQFYELDGAIDPEDNLILYFHMVPQGWRSEEHTSELQSLMRISYAVFCLKKKIIHYISHFDALCYAIQYQDSCSIN